MEEILVHSCKHDGRVHRRWPARIERREGSLVVLDAVFDEEVRHPLIGTIEAGTHSTEYFWTDRWYSVFRFQTPAGRLLKFYCNINTPARLSDGVLSFIDLDVDVWSSRTTPTPCSTRTSSSFTRNFTLTRNLTGRTSGSRWASFCE